MLVTGADQRGLSLFAGSLFGVVLFLMFLTTGILTHLIVRDEGVEVRRPLLPRWRLLWTDIAKIEVDLLLSNPNPWMYVRFFRRGSMLWPRSHHLWLRSDAAVQAAEAILAAAASHLVPARTIELPEPPMGSDRP
jgi:hypothetical protein